MNVVTRSSDSSRSEGGCGCGATAHGKDHPYGCACERCRSWSCDLECLVHPRFYCGQLLTDRDLGLLVDWVKAGSGLARFRHGWGVVCGLDLRCDPEAEAGVVLAPGYAIGCCGEDIVVCAEERLDLSAWCPAPDCAQSEGSLGADESIELWGRKFSRREIAAIDLYLVADEKLTDPQAARGIGACSTSTTCEYGRVEEGHRLCARPVQHGAPVGVGVTNGDSYDASALDAILANVVKASTRDAAVAALVEWCAKHPSASTCGLLAAVADPVVGELTGDELGKWSERLGFAVLEDWLRGYARRACFSCDDARGVPLARVLLWRQDKPKPRCRVLRIDAFPPYRRPLQHGEASSDAVLDLRHLIGLPLYSAVAELARLGVTVVRQRPFTVAEWSYVKAPPRLGLVSDGEPRTTVQVYTLDDDCGTTRVLTVVPAPSAAEIDLEHVSEVGDARKKKLQEGGVRDVIDLVGTPTERLQEVLGITPPDAMLQSVKQILKDLAVRHPGFLPPQ